MSRLPFELFLALRYLRPKRTFVSVITLISVMGVMLGVAVLIIVISVMTGFDRQLREKILGFNAHMRVVHRESTMTDWPARVKSLQANPEVKGVAPFVMGQVLVKTQPREGNPMIGAPLLRGIDPKFETNITVLHTNVVLGEFHLDGRSVLAGSEFARAMRLHVGDRLVIYSPRSIEEMERILDEVKKGKRKDIDEAYLPEEFTVRGIFDVGYYEYNANVIVTSLENAQDLYRLNDAVHGLFVMLHDPLKVEEVRARLWYQWGADHTIATWTEDNSGILDALIVEKNVQFYLLFFIMIVAAFGIMNSLITFVVQKTREIGMLKAIGASRGQVLRLFLSQSLVVGVIGVVTGFGLGLLAVHYRNEFLQLMRRWSGLDLFPSSIYSFSELPALIVAGDIAVICGSALVICVLAGLAPAWIAGRLKPVEALRHE